MQNLNQLKREIDAEVRVGLQPTKEKQEKIREYIDTCFEKMPILEFEFLEKALAIVPMKYSDMVNFTKKCAEFQAYGKAAVTLKDRKKRIQEDITPEQDEKLSQLQKNFVKAYRVREAMLIMKKGNYDMKIISRQTGLSYDEINILKLKMANQQITTIKGPSAREKIVEMLYEFKDPYRLQEKYGISDFEMDDMRDQAGCKRLKPRPKETDIEMRVKQDSQIRSEMLCLKLGTGKEKVAKMFKISEEELQKHINAAIQYGLIKENQIDGIDPLASQNIPFDQLEL